MGKFQVSSVINLEDVKEGQEFAESDFAAQTPSGKFVQMKYIDEEDKKLEPYIVKAGIWSIEKTMAGLTLLPTEMIQDKILESFVITKEITDKVDCFFNKIDVYKKLGFDVAKRTILLYGPAGTGKSTVINKVIRNYTDSETAVLVWGTDKLEAHLIKDFFKSFDYQGVKKVILVVEDIGGVEMEETRMRSDPSLLSLLDNQEKAFKIPTLILATTNHPEMFLGNLTNRPNRIDDKIEVGYPPAEARVELLAFFMGKTVAELEESVKKAFLDKACANFSPAHIREVLIRSMIYDKNMVDVIKEMNDEVALFNKAFAKTKELGIGSRY
jgi:ATP-dependent 26S proteasome regulatory subunit